MKNLNNFKPKTTNHKQEYPRNLEIRSYTRNVRVSVEGKSILVHIQKAIETAEGLGLDLIQISKTHDGVPICVVEAYDKFKYNKQKEEQKKEKAQRASAKKNELKEIRILLSIDEHDLQTKINQTISFLEEGQRVKWVLRFKGREIDRPVFGMQMFENIKNKIGKLGMAGNLTKEGKVWNQIWAPTK